MSNEPIKLQFKLIVLIYLILPTFIIAQNKHSLDSLVQQNKIDLITKKVDSIIYVQGHYMDKDKDSAIYFTNLGLKYAKKVNLKAKMTQLELNICVVHYNLAEYNISLKHAENALKYAKETDDFRKTYSAYHMISNNYAAKQDYYKALSSLNKCLELFNNKDENQTGYYGMLMIAMSANYIFIENYDEALEKAMEGLNSFEEVDHKVGMIASNYCLGKIFLEKNQNEKALNYYKNGINIALKQEGLGEYRLLEGYVHLLKYYEELNDYTKIEDYLSKIKALNQDFKEYPDLKSKINYAKAIISKKNGDLSSASQYAIQGLYYSSKINVKESYLHANVLLDIAKKTKNVDSLIKYSSLITKYSDSIGKINSDNTYYRELLRFEKSKVILNKEVELQKIEKIQQAKNKKFTLILIIALIALIVLVLYLLIKEKQLVNSQKTILINYEEKQNLEEKIRTIESTVSSDLHDNFGNKLAGIITAHEIIKEINDNCQSLGQGNLKRFTHLLEKNLIPLTEDIKDLLWANKKENNRLSQLVEKIGKKIDNINAIDIVIHNNTFTELLLPKLANKQILLIIKESITNVLKHSNSNKVDVYINAYKDFYLEIRIKDYGKGFDLKNLKRINGLNNMKNRAKSISFNFNIESKLNEGTVISIKSTIPLESISNVIPAVGF